MLTRTPHISLGEKSVKLFGVDSTTKQYIEAHREKNKFFKSSSTMYSPSEKLKTESIDEMREKIIYHSCGISCHLAKDCFKQAGVQDLVTVEMRPL